MAGEKLAPADVEAMAVTWLAGKLGSGIGIHTDVPNPRPAKFLEVSSAGGLKRDVAYFEGRLVFKAWALNETDAFALAQLAYAHMFDMAGETVNGTYVRKVVEVGGITSSPDPETKLPRYQFTAGPQCRVTVL